VFLFDDVFTKMDVSSTKAILNNFERLLPHKTLIISTALTSIIRPNDRVIVIDYGSVVEYGEFTTLVGNPSSYIHTFMKNQAKIL
jgi:ABC-type multidrug transport system fused ATPase/permease subunit